MEVKLDVPWRDYVALTNEVYRLYPQYRDSMSPMIKDIVSGKSLFSRQIEQSWAGVYDNGKLLAAAMLISRKQHPDYLSLAFFESLDDSSAVRLLLDQAKRTAATRGIGTGVAGINGHMNYGMGFLCDNFDHRPSFLSTFNPPYYYHNFKDIADKEHGLTSYIFDLAAMDFAKFKAIFARLNKRITYRTVDLKKLKQEMETYTHLINACFGEHPFYWERTPEENFEMVEAFRPFMRGENLIFAEQDGQPVGYILWHPDFNELISAGKSIGLTTLIKYYIGWPRITRFKVAEIGVLPKFKGSGLIFGLFHHCFTFAQERFVQCESGWVLNDNILSGSLAPHFGGSEYKHYKVLEFSV